MQPQKKGLIMYDDNDDSDIVALQVAGSGSATRECLHQLLSVNLQLLRETRNMVLLLRQSIDPKEELNLKMYDPHENDELIKKL